MLDSATSYGFIDCTSTDRLKRQHLDHLPFITRNQNSAIFPKLVTVFNWKSSKCISRKSPKHHILIQSHWSQWTSARCQSALQHRGQSCSRKGTQSRPPGGTGTSRSPARGGWWSSPWHEKPSWHRHHQEGLCPPPTVQGQHQPWHHLPGPPG